MIRCTKWMIIKLMMIPRATTWARISKEKQNIKTFKSKRIWNKITEVPIKNIVNKWIYEKYNVLFLIVFIKLIIISANGLATHWLFFLSSHYEIGKTRLDWPLSEPSGASDINLQRREIPRPADLVNYLQ